MKNLILVTLTLWNLTAVAAELGTELKPVVNPNGNLAFGAAYTYGDDPDGKSYLLTLKPSVSPSESSRQLLWSFYQENVGYIVPLDNSRVTTLGVIQIKLTDSKAVETILKNQGIGSNKALIYFVLADPTTKAPLYQFPISRLCATHPKHFGDLTNGKPCDSITNP